MEGLTLDNELSNEPFINHVSTKFGEINSRMSVMVAHQKICDLMRISPEFASRLRGSGSLILKG